MRHRWALGCRQCHTGSLRQALRLDWPSTVGRDILAEALARADLGFSLEHAQEQYQLARTDLALECWLRGKLSYLSLYEVKSPVLAAILRREAPSCLTKEGLVFAARKLHLHLTQQQLAWVVAMQQHQPVGQLETCLLNNLALFGNTRGLAARLGQVLRRRCPPPLTEESLAAALSRLRLRLSDVVQRRALALAARGPAQPPTSPIPRPARPQAPVVINPPAHAPHTGRDAELVRWVDTWRPSLRSAADVPQQLLQLLEESPPPKGSARSLQQALRQAGVNVALTLIYGLRRTLRDRASVQQRQWGRRLADTFKALQRSRKAGQLRDMLLVEALRQHTQASVTPHTLQRMLLNAGVEIELLQVIAALQADKSWRRGKRWQRSMVPQQARQPPVVRQSSSPVDLSVATRLNAPSAPAPSSS